MNKTNYFEMGQQQFYGRIKNKKAKIISGYGNTVDKHKDVEAFNAMEDILAKMYPDYKITILSAGRFGLGKDKKNWEFDVSMTGLGHPEFWIPGSRGYYALTKNSLFLFPKSDMDFQSEYGKLFSDMLNIKIENLKPANSWAESILERYLNKIKQIG